MVSLIVVNPLSVHLVKKLGLKLWPRNSWFLAFLHTSALFMQIPLTSIRMYMTNTTRIHSFTDGNIPSVCD